MRSTHPRDQLLQPLAELRALEPDRARGERTRALCRARLARKARRSGRAAALGAFGRRVLAPAVVAGLGALYLASLVGHALRLRGGS